MFYLVKRHILGFSLVYAKPKGVFVGKFPLRDNIQAEFQIPPKVCYPYRDD